MLASISAFVAAVALLFAAISTIGFRKAWPTTSFVVGMGVGIVVGCSVDLWCYHIMHSA